MKLVYSRPRKPTNRGPYIHIFKGKSYRFDIGVPVEVDDEVGHDILALVGDIMEKSLEKPPVKKKKASKKKADPAPKNKMLEEAPQNKLEG